MDHADARPPIATPAGAQARAGTDPGARMPSLPFLWWALGLALTAGFCLGMALFLALALRFPIGAWWPAAVQAHGHVQLYGWGGMFALGIGLFFLPRLRGCPPPSPRLVRRAATLMGVGLALRGLCQPLARPGEAGPFNAAMFVGLLLSGPLELAGAGLAVLALVGAARKGPPLRTRTGLLAVLPFALCFVAALLLGLALNALAIVRVTLPMLAGATLLPPAYDWATVHLGLDGMLVPISAAISARTFPLYLKLRVPPARELYAVAALFLAGFGLRFAAVPLTMAGPASLDPDFLATVGLPLAALGALLEGASFLALPLVLDVPLRRTPRDLAGREGQPKSEDVATEWLIVTAYVWLAVAGLLLIAEGLAGLTPLAGLGRLPAPPPDAVRHALGAGLVTLLILGMAPRLVPGFVGRPLHSAHLVWATVWLGNGAALLRVAPLFLPSSPLALGLMGLAGALGVAAVACLALNLWRTAPGPTSRRHRWPWRCRRPAC
jgi:uncharacterized protein involved in response to NO